MPGKSKKINRKIRKALVYYRIRTPKNRETTSSRNSLGNRKRKENNRQLEIRNNIHGLLCKKTINYITKYMLKVDVDHKNFRGKVLCSAGLGKGYTERPDAQNHKNILS